MFPRRINVDSIFSFSLIKYILRKDVVFVDQNIIIKPNIEKFIKPNKKYMTKKDGKIIIKIPIKNEKAKTMVKSDSLLDGFLDLLAVKTKKEGLDDFWLYKNFLMKINLEPGFYRDVLKRVRRLRWFKGHRRELAYLILMDIFHPEIPSIQQSNLYYEEENVTKDVSRQRRLLRSVYYPELFFRHPKELIERKIKKTKQEGNISYFSSLSMENLDFGIEYWPSTSLTFTLNQQFESSLPVIKDIEWMASVTSIIKRVTADEVNDILEFGDELDQVLKSVMLRVTTIDYDRQLLVDEIQKKTEVTESFRELLNTAILIRWFSIKSKKEKNKMLCRKHRIKFTQEEAKESVNSLLKYHDDPDEVYSFLYFAEKVFQNIAKPEYASWINEERNKIKGLSSFTH